MYTVVVTVGCIPQAAGKGQVICLNNGSGSGIDLMKVAVSKKNGFAIEQRRFILKYDGAVSTIVALFLEG